MPTAHDIITGQNVDTASEAWRHSCECRWLLAAKPTRSDKHLYLYGVPNRSMLFEYSSKTGKPELATDHTKRWQIPMPLMKVRGIEAADRILDGAKKIYEATK